MIIDKTNPEHASLPDSLDGEVLLEVILDGSGAVTGYITATQTACDRMRKTTPAKRAQGGWDKYQGMLDALPQTLSLA